MTPEQLNQLSKDFTEEHFTNPTTNDYILIRLAMEKAAIATADRLFSPLD